MTHKKRSSTKHQNNRAYTELHIFIVHHYKLRPVNLEVKPSSISGSKTIYLRDNTGQIKHQDINPTYIIDSEYLKVR